MPSLTLSKSTYIRGLQCEKSLFLHKKHGDLRNPISESQQAIFDQGTSVGELAQQLFPGGVDCSPEDYSKFNQSFEDTKKHIAQGTPVIYEAAFKYDGVMVFADILVNDRDGWKVYEVKSSTSVKPTYVKDAALQTYVINKSGITLKDTFVVHINNQYVRNGELDIERLFTKVSIREELDELLQEIPTNISKLKETLKQDDIPEREIGPHCSDPYDCDFSGVCWKDVPDQSVFDVRGLRTNRKFQLHEEGVERLVDIPDDFRLSDKQRMQVIGAQTGESSIDKPQIKKFVDSLNYPLYYLDFETINPAIPLFDYSRPYEQLPFQYSVHIQEYEGAECIHNEYLAETDGTDPRIKFIQQLIKDCGTKGDVVVYNKGFEKGKLAALGNAFSHYAKSLDAIKERVVDLMIPFQKGWYYTPEMQGSYSIKLVLPALVPELSYSDMEIGDGGAASSIFASMAAGNFDGDHDKTRNDLLEYCKLDTWAMVKILDKLNETINR